MRYCLHVIIINCIIVARNYCRVERKKISTNRKKTTEGVRKVHSTVLLQVSYLSRNPTLWKMVT